MSPDRRPLLFYFPYTIGINRGREDAKMTANEKQMINAQGSEAFLVKDKSLKHADAPFYKWLRKNGFKHAWHKGHYDVCDWAFVNITHKLYAYGMPGVGIVKPIGNHAITLDEFYQIYGIYVKYDGLELMAFSKEEQKERHTVRHYVRTPDADTRRGLLEMLEKDGYQVEDDGSVTRQEIIESGFPVMINETDKVFNIIHNGADEAALVKSGRIKDLDEFYLYYKWSECTYDEYYAVVLKLFMKNGRYNEEEARKIMDGEEEYLKENYEKYIKGGEWSYSPYIVENYLFMEY